MGTLLYMALLGDVAISLVVTVCADECVLAAGLSPLNSILNTHQLLLLPSHRFGRRRMLFISCALKLLGAAAMAYVHGTSFWLLALAMTVGGWGPSVACLEGTGKEGSGRTEEGVQDY